jgi:two-component system response regulator NreC
VSETKRIRLVIVDDHPLFRQGLRQVVQSDARFDLVGEADKGASALELIGQTRPDLAVIDLNLPDMNGLDVAAKLRERHNPVRLVVLTMFKDEQAFNQAMNLGISGYVLKENAVSEIVSCLIAVAADVPYVCPSMSGFLLRRRDRAAALADRQPSLQDLTIAERRILKRVADKKTTRDIAAELFISPRTVESHRAKICSKLGLKGANSLLQYAIENRDALSALN